jgi:hypothetical protein
MQIVDCCKTLITGGNVEYESVSKIRNVGRSMRVTEYVQHRLRIIRLDEDAISLYDSRIDLDMALERAQFTRSS